MAVSLLIDRYSFICKLHQLLGFLIGFLTTVDRTVVDFEVNESCRPLTFGLLTVLGQNKAKRVNRISKTEKDSS